MIFLTVWLPTGVSLNSLVLLFWILDKWGHASMYSCLSVFFCLELRPLKYVHLVGALISLLYSNPVVWRCHAWFLYSPKDGHCCLHVGISQCWHMSIFCMYLPIPIRLSAEYYVGHWVTFRFSDTAQGLPAAVRFTLLPPVYMSSRYPSSLPPKSVNQEARVFDWFSAESPFLRRLLGTQKDLNKCWLDGWISECFHGDTTGRVQAEFVHLANRPESPPAEPRCPRVALISSLALHVPCGPVSIHPSHWLLRLPGHMCGCSP